MVAALGRVLGEEMKQFLNSLAGLSIAAVLSWGHPAEACGCFAPPSPAEPIVQAGERILFSVKEGKVTAHIQLQYSGDAKDFGWLVPLPSVPTLKLGSDEVFTRLNVTTQPTYATNLVQGNSCPQPAPSLFSCGCYAPVALSSGGFATAENSPTSPLVVTSSVGPYDYAVLRADDQTAMLQWLSDNQYFVPAGTDGAVSPYIRPGGYFLALRLKAGTSAGDVTPVVLEYPSALPMIPLILTSVGATPNMGIQVFLLGTGRGIPRNFHHVVINDALLDWANGAQNYGALVTRAVAEAPQKHAFVTEYAGSSSVMKDQLAPAGRFGTEQALAQTSSPSTFVDKLLRDGFAGTGPSGEPVLPSPVIRLLLAQVPYPTALAAKGVPENGFLLNLSYYLGTYRDQNPMDFVGYTFAFDAPSLAQQIFTQYVTPMREADALFDEFPKLTRLFTTLNPEDMTADPVFSFNPDLPDVSRAHTATLINDCGSQRLLTEQGWLVESAGVGRQAPAPGETPAALRVEALGEEGAATVTIDNESAIHARFAKDTDPTAVEPAPARNSCSTIDPMSLALLALMASLRRRRA